MAELRQGFGLEAVHLCFPCYSHGRGARVV